ncbi:hypothetical protein [Streptomyces sp. NPDC003395]
MPTMTVNVARKTAIQTIELALEDAPSLKVDYVRYETTGLRFTYTDGQLTDLTVIGVAEDTGENEEISTHMDRYDWVESWIRDLVEDYRPTA